MTMLAAPWIHRVLTGLSVLALLWFVFTLIVGGQPLWGTAVLVLGALLIHVYTSGRTLAWKYLLPGVAGMLLFVVFPLIYTVQIGFTNYSSSNLLSQDRARDYLLAQTEVDEAHTQTFTLHRDGSGLRLALTAIDGSVTVSAPLTLQAGATIDLQAGALPAGEALPLREVLRHRTALRATTLRLPDGRRLNYAGVREFGPVEPLWTAQDDGSLLQRETAQVFVPDRQQGFYVNAAGDRMQPGFKVGVGFANYTRMLGDSDFHGPFISIFVWTVVFSGLTVLFATALGMTLAVLLNWESLKYRTLYRTLLFLPYAVPGFISILVFKGLFNQNFGEINAILDAVFGVRPAWFADPLLAKTMLLIVNTWLGYPYIMVLCTGLIKSIPADLYEASAIAGATPLTNFFKITAPLIAKPLTPLLISAFAFNFNNFVLISLLTDGRPDYLNTKLPAGTTDILVSYTYRIAFTDSGQNFGLAAAISTLIFGMVALMAMLQLRITRQAKG